MSFYPKLSGYSCRGDPLSCPQQPPCKWTVLILTPCTAVILALKKIKHYMYAFWGVSTDTLDVMLGMIICQ